MDDFLHHFNTKNQSLETKIPSKSNAELKKIKTEAKIRSF